MKMNDKFSGNELLTMLSKLPGGYEYMGAASCQVCFPLRDGGELRFGIYDDEDGDDATFGIDIYSGFLPPGISGPVHKTGDK